MKKQLLISFSIFTVLVIATIIVVLYAKGYRFGLDGGRPEISGTGLLVLTSTPDGAEVFINDHLTTATDNTINLPPGRYTIRIFKEGYLPWQKTILVQKEVVAKADALLLPTAPTLQSITETGVFHPTLDPSKTLLAYTVASQTARINGIYVLDMTSKPILTIQSASTQIVDDTIDTFSQSMLAWSPDGKQLIATISSNVRTPTTYLLSVSSFNDSPQDVTATLDSTQTQWQTQQNEIFQSQINTIKPYLKDIVLQNFSILGWSSDQTKILYVASQSASLPIIISPRLIGTDTTEETRSLAKGAVYVYDIKEDKNFKILDSLNATSFAEVPIRWFSDSKHLLYVHDKKIDLMDYDGTNQTTVYAGPFTDNYVFPWPDAKKIVILTNLGNPLIPANLYTIDLQ